MEPVAFLIFRAIKHFFPPSPHLRIASKVGVVKKMKAYCANSLTLFLLPEAELS